MSSRFNFSFSGAVAPSMSVSFPGKCSSPELQSHAALPKNLGFFDDFTLAPARAKADVHRILEESHVLALTVVVMVCIRPPRRDAVTLASRGRS